MKWFGVDRRSFQQLAKPYRQQSYLGSRRCAKSWQGSLKRSVFVLPVVSTDCRICLSVPNTVAVPIEHVPTQSAAQTRLADEMFHYLIELVVVRPAFRPLESQNKLLLENTRHTAKLDYCKFVGAGLPLQSR